LPGAPAVVEVDLQLDEDSSDLKVTKKKITKKKKPTPTPAAAPTFTSRPAPSTAPTSAPFTPVPPTSVPVDTPTPVVIDTPTPYDTPTIAPGEPTATPTPTATAALPKAVFYGRLVSSDPSLLVDTSIRIASYSSWKPVQADGTFRFHAVPDPAHTVIAVRNSGIIGRIDIGTITANTTSVRMRLGVEWGPNKGGIKVTLLALTVLEGDQPSSP